MGARRTRFTSSILAGALAAAPAALAAPPLFAPGEALVRFRVAPGEAKRALGERGLEPVGEADPSGWVLVRGGTATPELVGALAADDRVERAEPNWGVGAAAVAGPGVWTPDDPWLARQWNLGGCPAAWAVTRGSADVVVAVLDTGYRAVAGEEAQVVLPGFDLVDGDDDPRDENGHGTHVSSILAQATDNGARAAGVAPGAALLPVRVLDAEGHGSVRAVAEGIYRATAAGADVTNLSLALHPAVLWSEALHDAVAHAAAHGVVLVASAGNDAGARVSLPARFNQAIAVGAAHSGGERAAYSNRGPGLDLLAPGGDDLDRDRDGRADGVAAAAFDASGREGLFLGSGTSQAAAHVSGVAALLLSAGVAERERVRAVLELTAARAGAAGWSEESGHGLLDPARALAERERVEAGPDARARGGWIPGQEGQRRDAWDRAALVAVLVRHGGELLLVIGDGSGVYGLADEAPGRVALHRLHAPTVAHVLAQPPGLRARLERAGGVLPFLERSGTRAGAFDAAGGMGGLVDGVGGLLGILESAGGTLGILESNGSLLSLLDGAGGILGLVEGVGGTLGLLESMGGFGGLVDGVGGVAAFLDASGGVSAIVDVSGRAASAARPLVPAQ